jgi:hypothetical protein
MAVMVHFENQGVPVAMLLDIVELACSHSGLNLAAAFAKILPECNTMPHRHLLECLACFALQHTHRHPELKSKHLISKL